MSPPRLPPPAELPWRERLSLRLMVALIVVLPVGFAVMHFLVNSVVARSMNFILPPVWIAAVVELRRPILGHRVRSLMFVTTMLVVCLVGYIAVGFLSGPIMAL